MKKLILPILTLTTLLTLTSCNKNGGGEIPMDNLEELLLDTKFESGFDLMTTSTTNGREVIKHIDYNGQAKKSETTPWKMAQWWTPFDFKDATYRKEKDTHHYENQSRHLSVNPKTGELVLDLNSYPEYIEKLGHSRTGSENWSHFLIEQDFKNAPKLCETKRVIVDLTFSIDRSINMDKSQSIPCAQISWYFTVTDPKNGDTGYQSKGDTNDFFWFGLPLYDSRYDFLSPYHHVDAGFEGATNKLIYSLGSNTYLEEKIQIGKTYNVKLDILPYIKEAFLYGVVNGAMADSDWTDLVLNYMNLGWELDRKSVV